MGSASPQGDTLLDRRLSLPQEWLTDEASADRRRACGVPAATVFPTKPMRGGAMLQAVSQAGTRRCRWVACDDALGRETTLLDHVAGLGVWYDAEVPHDTRVWQARPATAIPLWAGRGRKPTRAQWVAGAAAAQSVADIATAWSTSGGPQHLSKEGSTGPIVAECAVARVVAVREGLPGPEVWLILRRNGCTGALQTSLRHAPAQTPLTPLVRMSGMRWPIDTCVEEGKQCLGLGDDAVRSWRGWHHHMPWCILEPFFLVRRRCR